MFFINYQVHIEEDYTNWLDYNWLVRTAKLNKRHRTIIIIEMVRNSMFRNSNWTVDEVAGFSTGTCTYTVEVNGDAAKTATLSHVVPCAVRFPLHMRAVLFLQLCDLLNNSFLVPRTLGLRRVSLVNIFPPMKILAGVSPVVVCFYTSKIIRKPLVQWGLIRFLKLAQPTAW